MSPCLRQRTLGLRIRGRRIRRSAALHLYLTAYRISGAITGPGASQKNVDLTPYFIIGGQSVGRFGCLDNTNGSAGGQYLAASAGYVYVINLSPTCPDNGSGPGPLVNPEIDVYNTNGVQGVHTDIPPVFTLPLRNGLPLAVSLGPTGTATGGQALMQLKRLPFHVERYRAGAARVRAPLRPQHAKRAGMRAN